MLNMSLIGNNAATQRIIPTASIVPNPIYHNAWVPLRREFLVYSQLSRLIVHKTVAKSA